MTPPASDRSRAFRPRLGRAVLAVLAAGLVASGLRAQGESILSTVHNLSATGPGEIRALNEEEVCKFCHIPHNAEVPVPLWGRPLSEARYLTPTLRRSKATPEEAPQPDGSSRLCLSCHDGTVALGKLTGERSPIAMAGAQHLRPGHRGFIGTDLTGSHPISFPIAESLEEDPEVPVAFSGSDMTVKPLGAIEADPDVKLDGDGKMQCTSCHDPHRDRYYQPGKVPRFWVKPSVGEVCLTCHVLG